MIDGFLKDRQPNHYKHFKHYLDAVGGHFTSTSYISDSFLSTNLQRLLDIHEPNH